MKKIIIQKMTILNFKGVREQKIAFNYDITEIDGANGSGKTTIFDAFTWVLFGKDSKDSKKFNLKTIDEKNQIIPKIPHEVTITLSVDGEVVTLCRRLNEKWTKKRGEAEETFTGNEEERLWNDVPCSVNEWNDKIQSLCSEDVFKFITNPLYFSHQKADIQRTMLFRMAGGISDSDIANGNSDFTALLASLSGKTMEEYKKEVQAKKRRIKAEIDAIPERIDERKRDIPEQDNWKELEADKEKFTAELSDLNSQILDRSKAYEASSAEKMERAKKISSLNSELSALKLDISKSLLESYNKDTLLKSEIIGKISQKEAEVERMKSALNAHKTYLHSLGERRENLIQQWKKIKAKTLIIDEDAFVCPTCKRPLDVDKTEELQQQVTENFNQKKARELKANEVDGKDLKENIVDTESKISKTEESIAEAEKVLNELKHNTILNKEIEKPDTTPAIDSNEKVKDILYQIAQLEEENNKPIAMADVSVLELMKSEILESIDIIKERLAKRALIERNNERISELEKQLKTQSEEYAQLERIEFTMAAFAKAKIESIEKKINGMFRFVKFKMFEQQINGGEVETCEAMVNGIPYSSLNNAMTYIAGLDIINAISHFEGISAPIIIDNAESINEFPKMDTQMILLKVTTDSNLTIK